MDFLLYRTIRKSDKEFSWTVVFFLLVMLARARPLFLRTVFQILFRSSRKNGKRKSKNRYLSVEICFSNFAFDCNSEIRILKSKLRFPNRTQPKSFVEDTASRWIYNQLSPCGHPAKTDNAITRTAAKSPAKTNYRRLTEINCRYYRLSVMRTLIWGPYSVRYKESWPYKIYFPLQIFSLA